MSTVFGCPKSYLQKQAGMILLIFNVQHNIYLKPKHLFTVQTIFIIIINLFDKHFLIQPWELHHPHCKYIWMLFLKKFAEYLQIKARFPGVHKGVI